MNKSKFCWNTKISAFSELAQNHLMWQSVMNYSTFLFPLIFLNNIPQHVCKRRLEIPSTQLFNYLYLNEGGMGWNVWCPHGMSCLQKCRTALDYKSEHICDVCRQLSWAILYCVGHWGSNEWSSIPLIVYKLWQKWYFLYFWTKQKNVLDVTVSWGCQHLPLSSEDINSDNSVTAVVQSTPQKEIWKIRE